MALVLLMNVGIFNQMIHQFSLITPTLVIDNIYKSMEGPKVMRSFQLDETKNELVWITSFETKALSTNEVDQLSNDYICHTNIDLYEGEHYSRWQLDHRIGEQYPRLTSMSNGIESYSFPRRIWISCIYK